jgi:hypothetical protein
VAFRALVRRFHTPKTQPGHSGIRANRRPLDFQHLADPVAEGVWVRSAAFLSRALSFVKVISIGLRSGE